MKRLFIYSLLLVILHFNKAQAFSVTESKLLTQSIATADIVAVAKIIASPDKALRDFSRFKNLPPGVHIFPGEESFAYNNLKAAGTYTFEVTHTEKGQLLGKIEVQLPIVLPSYLGDSSPKFNSGENVLLLLRSNNGVLTPVDATLPLIPLSQTLPTFTSNISVQQRVIKLMLASFDDLNARQANSYLLREVVEPSLVTALAPYINDANPRIRDNVVYNMIVNQQVSAIPLVAQRVHEALLDRSSADSARALRTLTVPQAIPFLNLLLIDSSRYLRFNTVDAIGQFETSAESNRRSFDRSSIPFLLLSMRDPETMSFVAQTSYALLYDFSPELGQAQGNFYFEKNRAVETQKLLNWWRDELSSKHPRELMPGETLVVKTIPANIRKLSREQAVAVLNPLLWEMSSETRRAALAQLQKLADKSSVPYLLLACEDPDFDVAFGAYQLLGTLLPEVGAPVIRKTFEADRETALKPFYAWWQDELLDKHSVEGLKRFKQEQQMRRDMEARRNATPPKTPLVKPSLKPLLNK